MINVLIDMNYEKEEDAAAFAKRVEEFDQLDSLDGEDDDMGI